MLLTVSQVKDRGCIVLLTQEDADADAENGHGEPEPGHRPGSVGGPQEPVRPRPRARDGVRRLRRHLQRISRDVHNLKGQMDT